VNDFLTADFQILMTMEAYIGNLQCCMNRDESQISGNYPFNRDVYPIMNHIIFQNFLILGLCPSSGILKLENNASDTGFVYVRPHLRVEISTLLGPLGIARHSCYTPSSEPYHFYLRLSYLVRPNLRFAVGDGCNSGGLVV
jgi:hypothetical protein